MNLPTSRIDHSLDSVHTLAVTEFKEDVFTFRWNIRNFKERLNNKDPKTAILKSPLFTAELEEKNKNERQLTVNNSAAQATKMLKLDRLLKLDWQLQLKWSRTETEGNSTEEDTFLTVFLCLINYKKKEVINATFQVDLLDSEAKSWMNVCSGGTFDASRGWGCSEFMNTRSLLDPKKNLLEGDTLKLQCRIAVKRDVEHQLSPLKVGSEGQKRSLLTNFRTMFTSSIFTDVLIKTEGSSLKAHKAVLSCHSPVFLAMFKNEMAESVQNVLEIVDFDDDIVRLMLEYIYGVEISQKDLTENALQLFHIADKYDIRGLKDLIEEVLALNLSVKTVVDTLILADMNSVLNLKTRAIKFVNMNKNAVMKSDGFQKLLNYNLNPSIFKELFTNQ